MCKEYGDYIKEEKAKISMASFNASICMQRAQIEMDVCVQKCTCPCYPSWSTSLFSSSAPQEKKEAIAVPLFRGFHSQRLNVILSILFLCRVDSIGSGSPSLPTCCQIGDVPAVPHVLLAFPFTLSLNISLAAKGMCSLLVRPQVPEDCSCVLHYLVSK